MTTRVLVTDHPFDTGLGQERQVLEPLGVKLVLANASDADSLAELAQGVAGILTCYAQISDTVIEAARGSCRVISRYGIGYDNIDVDAATRQGVVVTTVPDYCLDEVADHTLALLLSVARGVHESARTIRAGGWGPPAAPVHRLQGRSLALLGYGAIGRRVARRARAFGLEVSVYDPYAEQRADGDVHWCDSPAQAVALADFVSLHMPLTTETRHVVNEGLLACARRAPVLINTSRGGLVDLVAVERALDGGRLAAAALDVTEPEPLPADHPLRRHPRALVTPHTAYHSEESQAELQRRAAEEVARVLRGERPQHPRNPEVLDTTAPPVLGQGADHGA